LRIYSFNESKSRGIWSGFSLKWYRELLLDEKIIRALYYTILIAILSSVIATIIGTIAALGLQAFTRKLRSMFMDITYIPVLNPDLVTGISLMILFIFLRFKLGFATMLIAHITFNVPYVILSVLPKLKQLDNNIFEAAIDLGASPFYAFRKVILPEIFPGILTGFLLALTLSVDDFVISFFTTGSGVTNLSITIYSMARRGLNPKINALSTIMFAAVLTLLIIINKQKNNDKNKKEEKRSRI
jgi:spermidine/putrescine transport system permease protein